MRLLRYRNYQFSHDAHVLKLATGHFFSTRAEFLVFKMGQAGEAVFIIGVLYW